jgi:hypothetical protein
MRATRPGVEIVGGNGVANVLRVHRSRSFDDK